MFELFQTLKKTISMPMAQSVIGLCCAMPSLRYRLSRMGVTPARFANRVIRVPIRHCESLLMIGAESVHLVFQLFWRGIDYYEPFTRTVIEMLTRPVEWFIDVGANIGFFSLISAKLNSCLKVIAFEPNPRMFAFLSEHKRLNGLSNLTTEPLAVSNRDGEAQLFLNSSDMSASLEADFQSNFNPAVGSVPVKTTTLDSYVQQSNISGSLLVKVDVEGHDKPFLEGAQGTIDKFKPEIIIEVLGEFDPLLITQFQKHGYRFYKITDQGLIETKVVSLTKRGDFVFYNYLFTTRRAKELNEISKTIRERARHIDLYRTSKFADHPV